MPTIKKLIGKSYSYYQSVGSVYCPILDETVYFTSDGFKHLLYQSHRRRRKVSEQYMKLSVLQYAPQVLQNVTNIAQTRSAQKKVKGVWKKVVQYALVYEVQKGIQVRVIVEKVGNSNHKFASVMPHNKKSKPPKKAKKRPSGR